MEMGTTRTSDTNPKRLTVLEGPEARNLLRLAETAHLPGHLREVEAQAERLLGAQLKWKPVGGEGRVAHSALGSAAESTHLLSEPVVNFFDAGLEMAYLLALKDGDDYRPQSIYEAAERWYEIPPGGLPAWDTRSGDALTAFRDLARKSQLLVYPGSRTNTPTVVFLDHWLGQHPADHEDTILSLQKGLKADIPFLAGQYGHGAGFTFAFSHGGQILISRRHPELCRQEHDDLVGLSLVVRKMPSETGTANVTYWYAVAPDTHVPLAFRPSALGDPRWHGLRRTCIDYEMYRSTDRDIYFALDHNITTPALPYMFRDERIPAERRQARFMAGNASRLQSTHEGRRAGRPGTHLIHVPHRRTSRVDLDAWMDDGQSYGTVDVVTTYVYQDDTDRGNELYAPAKEAEVWTLNGQRHHARSRLHFGQEPIRLEAIRDNLLVDIQLDGLSADAKALIMTTDRQGAAEREARFALEKAIDDLLATDTDLRALNDEARDAALRAAASSSRKDLDRELRQFQHFVRKETKRVRLRTTKKVSITTGRPPRIKLEPIAPLFEHPTFLRFRKNFRQVLRVAPDRTTSVLLEADAIDGYFGGIRQPSFAFHPDVGTALRVISTDTLKDGRMRVRLRAAADAALGATRFVATYLPPSVLAPLTTEIDVEIAEPKPRKPGKGREREVETWEYQEEEQPAPPGYAVLFEERTPTWASAGMSHWADDVVGQYKTDVAYVNGDYGPVKRLLEAVPTDKQEEYLGLYLAPIIMMLVGLAKKESDPPKDEDTGEPIVLHDGYRDAALEGIALSSIFTIRKLRKLGLQSDVDED
jgi:hypothetical protein